MTALSSRPRSGWWSGGGFLGDGVDDDIEDEIGMPPVPYSSFFLAWQIHDSVHLASRVATELAPPYTAARRSSSI